MEFVCCDRYNVEIGCKFKMFNKKEFIYIGVVIRNHIVRMRVFSKYERKLVYMRNLTLYRIWKLFDKKYIFLLQIITYIFMAYLLVYTGKLARLIVDGQCAVNGNVIINFCVYSMIGMICAYSSAYVKESYAAYFSCKLKMLGMKKILTCKYKFIDNEHSGVWINKVSYDVKIVTEYMANCFPEFISNMVSFIFCLVYLVTVNWFFLAMCIVFVPIITFTLNKLSKPTYNTINSFWDRMDKLSVYARDSVVNQLIEKVYGIHNIRRNRFAHEMDKATKDYVDYEFWVAKASPIKYLIESTPTIICIVMGVISSYCGKVTNGELIVFILLLGNVSGPLSKSIGYITDFRNAKVSMNRVLELLDLEDERMIDDYCIKNENADVIKFDNVKFSYGERSIIDGVSYTVHRNEMVAIVGESGSGKSTLLKLIMNLYDVSDGGVYVFGENILDWNLYELRKQMAYVEQRPYLFQGTIEENIRCGIEDATSSDVEIAARKAHAHDFIITMSMGYHTLLCEGGNNLSEGQKQRIALARAFLKNAPILLLDEVTSALDEESEKLVKDAIEELKKNRTVIMVAHRLSTIASADKIIVLDNGRIIEEGRHEQLLRNDGIYANLYKDM